MKPEDIWNYFESAVVPEIRSRQVHKQMQNQNRGLGDCVCAFSQAAPIHEVLLCDMMSLL